MSHIYCHLFDPYFYPSPLLLTFPPLRRAIVTVEQTHNMSLYMDIRRRLYQATGDAKYSLDQEECVQFVMATNKRSAVIVSCARRASYASPSLSVFIAPLPSFLPPSFLSFSVSPLHSWNG